MSSWFMCVKCKNFNVPGPLRSDAPAICPDCQKNKVDPLITGGDYWYPFDITLTDTRGEDFQVEEQLNEKI